MDLHLIVSNTSLAASGDLWLIILFVACIYPLCERPGNVSRNALITLVCVHENCACGRFNLYSTTVKTFVPDNAGEALLSV